MFAVHRARAQRRLDFATRLPFVFKHKSVSSAVKRGVSFEIDIAPALRNETARRNLLANALMLTRVAKGAAIVVTCGAASAIELRGPYDLINLCVRNIIVTLYCSACVENVARFALC